MAFSPIPGLTLPASASMVPAKVATKTAAPTKTTTPVKTTVTADPFAKALAAQPSLATLLAQASTQANRLAQQQIAAQIAAIQQQQDQAHATALAQHDEIIKASQAAAQFLTPLGDMARDDYTAAVNNLGGMVGGYTGGLRDTAQAAQDAAQAQLAGISGNTQTVEGQGANLANLLYGVSGSIPANALTTQGLGATALARAIPQQELSYGQQQAIGQIGAGNTAADALNTQLATARAQLPTLTQQYLKQFQDSAQSVADAAHQRLMDANTIRNTTSEIATRKATLKARTDAAAAKAKPHIDVSQSKLTGILSDQNGKPITKNVGGKQFLQTLPGFHFDNKGLVVADPKPMTIDQQMARAAEWTRVNHYQSQWNGDPVGGKITPTGGWVVSPDGQSAVPPTKPGKAFIPKIDKTISAANGAITYYDPNVAKWVEPRDPKTGKPIPYDPSKPVQLQAKVSNGYWVMFDSSTGKWTKAVDENQNPLPAGTPKAPPTGHFVGRYPGADGFYHVYNSVTGEDKSLGTRVLPKDAAAGSWVKVEDPVTHKISFYNPTTQVTQDTPFKGAATTASQGTWRTLGPDQHGNYFRINNVTNERQPLVGYHPLASGAVGTYSNMKSPDGKHLWRINSVTNKIVKTNIPWPTSSSGALSAEAVSSYTDRVNALLRAAENGIPADPDKGTPAHPPVTSRFEAIEQLKAAGYLTKALTPLTMAILNEYYPRAGASGRNWFRVPANLGR